MPHTLTDGYPVVTSNVVSFPHELFERSQPPGWQSVGEAAGSVLSGVAYRCAFALRAYPILREEGGELVELIPFTARQQNSGVAPPATLGNRQALRAGAPKGSA